MRINKLTLPIMFLIVLQSPTAYAEVDLSNGSFILRDESSLPRIYNSRSLYSGLLGFGWCTPFEDSIYDISINHLRLRDCQSSQVLSFQVQKAQLRSPSSSLMIYKSGNDTITSDGTRFTHTTQHGAARTFDKRGRLLSVSDERGKLSKVLYDKNGFIKEIRIGRMESFVLRVAPRTGRVVEVTDPRGARTRLTFLNGLLISAADDKRTKFYSYDKVANLTEVSEGTKSTKVEYNSSDQVSRVVTAKNCHETYSYTQSPLKGQTEVTTNCKGINNKRLIDFYYAKGSNGEISLKKFSIRTPAMQSMEQR